MNYTMHNLKCAVAISSILIGPLLGCRESDEPKSTSQEVARLEALATKVAVNIGEVREVSYGGPRGPVFLFEEVHTSRVGQLQIATMLLRLHDRNGLKLIGLEGSIQSPRPLDAAWFHTIGGAEAQGRREDVALRMLGEGEISAPEFMGLVLADVQVHGVELNDEYDVKLNVQGNPAAHYLLGIAETYLSQNDIERINELGEEGRQQEAFEVIKNADPWVSASFESLERKYASVEEQLELLRGIQQKAEERGVEVEANTREEMEEVVGFFAMADQRSATMSARLSSLLEATDGTPVAMVIGAAHSPGTVKRLAAQGMAVVLLRPVGFDPDGASLPLEQFERKNELLWARVNEGTLGRLLNTPRKPPPIIETATAKSYASAYFAALIVAEGVREGRQIPGDVRDELDGLPALRVDLESFGQDGYDVIFRMWVVGTDEEEREVWARVGSSESVEESKNLEEKLLHGIADLGGGGGVPPRQPPGDSDGTGAEEGPGDGRRGQVVINRVGRRALAVFAENKSKVEEVGRISG